jgi:ketosteroid isomerase-like protein
MDTREIIENYYKFANAGDWDSWCNLFADNMIMDEQLAGHIESLAVLKPMMAGMDTSYKKFQNLLKEIIIEGDRVAVVSHISALAAKYPDIPIEANVMNYFVIKEGKISYMANFHDSKPFKPFLDQFK